MDYEYVFLNRWILPVSPGDIYDAMVDYDLYPTWGHPSYVYGRRDGELNTVGCKGTIVVQGALPYKMRLDCTITGLVAAREIACAVTGDVDGEVLWTMRPMGSGDTELVMDWRCSPRWPLLRAAGPLCRPLFRWNHDQCKNAAIAGLSRYLARRSTQATPPPVAPRPTTLAVGDRAPDFTLPSTGGRSVGLSSLLAKGPVVVFFYPKDDTPGCSVEACAFRDRYHEFEQAGASVVGISSDSIASHESFASKFRLPITLLSDADGSVRALFGVRPDLGFIPGRATFVIEPTGVVRSVLVSQLRLEAHAREALAVVRELRRETARGQASAHGPRLEERAVVP
jgi:peroxiredoxin Q/BCP